jgi:spore germination cell wall hydrolase CwlJ-like protein
MNRFMIVFLLSLGAMAIGTSYLTNDETSQESRPHFLGGTTDIGPQQMHSFSKVGNQSGNTLHSPAFTAADVELVAKTIWGEARSEGHKGMIAVGKVIVNRALHPHRWPNSVKEVVFQSKQFSCWNRKDPNRKLLSRIDQTDPTYQQAYQIAISLLKRPSFKSNGAFYYHTKQVNPEWAQTMTPLNEIGNHIFYSH